MSDQNQPAASSLPREGMTTKHEHEPIAWKAAYAFHGIPTSSLHSSHAEAMRVLDEKRGPEYSAHEIITLCKVPPYNPEGREPTPLRQQIEKLIERHCAFNCDAESGCDCRAHDFGRDVLALVAPEGPEQKNWKEALDAYEAEGRQEEKDEQLAYQEMQIKTLEAFVLEVKRLVGPVPDDSSVIAQLRTLLQVESRARAAREDAYAGATEAPVSRTTLDSAITTGEGINPTPALDLPKLARETAEKVGQRALIAYEYSTASSAEIILAALQRAVAHETGC